MKDLILTLLMNLLGDKCYHTYFHELRFSDVQCFKVLISKCLGMAIIAGSILVKVPQLLKLYQNKSGKGINIMSVIFDLTAITFHMSYSFMSGYPFSAWGDNTFLALQTAGIGALVLYYNGQKTKSLLFCIIYAAFVFILNSGLTPMKVLTVVQTLNIPILLFGKLSQALTNYRNGSTGQLSGITLSLLFAGSLARIFTSVQETGDMMMIITFIASTFANGVILAQFIYYSSKKSKPTPKKVEKAKAKKTN